MRIRKCILMSIFTLSLVLGDLSHTSAPTLAAQATPQTDEYADTKLSKYIETTINHQLIAALSGSNGTKAKIKATKKSYYKSQLTFTFDRNKIGWLTNAQILFYLEEAINDNPNLCTLSTEISVRWTLKTAEVTVYSMVKKKQHAATIRRYKNFLANIEYIPKEAAQMSDHEILLYLHDRLIQHANYASDTNDPVAHVPYSFSNGEDSVCQAYAATLNHMMRDLGFTCHVLWSTTHGWNVVKLNGKWTNIDATWDDPVKSVRDTVLHNYFLVSADTFKSGHTPDPQMEARYSGLMAKATTGYKVLPKSENILTPVCYRAGQWLYVKSGRVYRWDGVSATGTQETAISWDKNRCLNVINHTVYVGGNDGIYKYDPDTGVLQALSTSVAAEGLLYYSRSLYYRQGTKWIVFATYDSETSTYEKLNGTGNVEKYTLVKPGKPVIVGHKSSARSVRVAISSAAAKANGGYQVQIATNSSFTANKKSKTITGTSVSFTGLTAGRTYYVRARGIWKSGYLKKYGEWSKTLKG